MAFQPTSQQQADYYNKGYEMGVSGRSYDIGEIADAQEREAFRLGLKEGGLEQSRYGGVYAAAKYGTATEKLRVQKLYGITEQSLTTESKFAKAPTYDIKTGTYTEYTPEGVAIKQSRFIQNIPLQTNIISGTRQITALPQNVTALTYIKEKPAYETTGAAKAVSPFSPSYKAPGQEEAMRSLRGNILYFPARLIGESITRGVAERVKPLAYATSYVSAKYFRKPINPEVSIQAIRKAEPVVSDIAFGASLSPFTATSTSTLNAGFIKQTPIKKEYVTFAGVTKPATKEGEAITTRGFYYAKESKKFGYFKSMTKFEEPTTLFNREVIPTKIGGYGVEGTLKGMKIKGTPETFTTLERGITVPFDNNKFLYTTMKQTQKVGEGISLKAGMYFKGLPQAIKPREGVGFISKGLGVINKNIITSVGLTKSPGTVVISGGRTLILPKATLMSDTGGQLALLRPPQLTIQQPFVTPRIPLFDLYKTQYFAKVIPTPVLSYMPKQTVVETPKEYYYTITPLKSIEETRTIDRLSTPPLAKSDLKYSTVQTNITEQVNIQEVVPKLTYKPQTIRTPNLDLTPPKVPLKLVEFKKYQAPQSLKARQAYALLIRRGGKFVEVGKGFTLGEGLKRGVEATKSSLAATFRLVEKGTTLAPERQYKVPFEFEAPKSTSRLKAPLTFIQKRGFRLSARPEVSEIMAFKRKSAKKGGMRLFK